MSISVHTIGAFDSNYDKAITFVYTGNQSVKNKLTIYESTTNAIVYDQEQTTFKLSHTIPAETLVNGTNYNCHITAYDTNNNGITSSRVSFLCLKTPIWEFQNITPNQIIKNASYEVNLRYEQAQNELLNEFKIVIYTSGLSVFFDSETIYGDVVPINITSLADSTLYYLRAMGTTVNGIYLDTEYIPFSVEYESPMLYSVITLENKELEGLVKITSNIVTIEGTSIPEDIEYIDSEMIDLRPNGYSVTFNEGFNLSGEYRIEFLGFDFPQNKTILTLGVDDDSLKIIWRKGLFHNGKNIFISYIFAEIRSNTQPTYVVYSNRILEPKNTDIIHVWLRRVNGLYEIKIYNKGVIV